MQARKTGTAVAKDLQYYPTPQKVIEKIFYDLYIRKEDKVLEPSCGCGRFLDEIRKHTKNYLGIEYDLSRVQESKAKGHPVLHANFLETQPTEDYDKVIMNPPFYGKHYYKHIEHAMKFLKKDGVLTAILPITARYDHGLITGNSRSVRWNDLPVGSFSESGTNINTTILTMFK